MASWLAECGSKSADETALFKPRLTDFDVTGPTVRAPLSVQRPAFDAAVVHLAGEKICDDRAQDQDAAQYHDTQERVLQLLCFSLKP